MDTFDPLLNNEKLRELCALAREQHDTPLVQARAVIAEIAKVRRNSRLKRYTKEERRQINEAKRIAGIKPWREPYEDTQSYDTRSDA